MNAQTQNRRGRHAVVGQLVGLDSIALEAVVRTDLGRKVICSELEQPLVVTLAGRMLQGVLLVGIGTWGQNGALVAFRPTEVVDFHVDVDSRSTDFPPDPGEDA